MKAYTIIKELPQDIKLISLIPDIIELNERKNKLLWSLVIKEEFLTSTHTKNPNTTLHKWHERRLKN